MAKAEVEREKAVALAEKIRARLADGCERIEIAGSLRRGNQKVGDIELVAIPRIGLSQHDSLWSEPRPLLEPILSQLVRERKLYPVKQGPRHRQYQILTVNWPIQLDLFLTDAEGWGYTLAIRTGPADYSQKLVTGRHKGGKLEYGFRCHDGHVWRIISGSNDVGAEVREIDGHPHVMHPVPEETDFFNLIKGGYVPPEKRRHQ